eukprot:340543-Amphidinium_carterae.1
MVTLRASLHVGLFLHRIVTSKGSTSLAFDSTRFDLPQFHVSNSGSFVAARAAIGPAAVQWTVYAWAMDSDR